MADKIMRIGGRGEDGTAKPIKTDNAGNVGMQLLRGKEQLNTYIDAVTINPSDEFVLLPKTKNTSFQSIIVNIRWAIDTFTKYLVKVNYYNEYDLIIHTETFNEFNSGAGVAGFSLKHPKYEVVIKNTSDATQLLRRFSVVGSLADSIENKKMNLLAKNTVTGKSVPLSAAEDTAGESVLRVVDAAPFAYDAIDNTLRITMASNPTTNLKEFINQNALITLNAMNYGQNSLSSSSQVVPLDISNIKSFSFYVKNTYNQAISVKVRAFSSSVAGSVIIDASLIGDQSLNPGASKFYTPSEFPQLKDMVVTGLCVTLERGATAPTTGSTEIRMYGKAL